MNKLIGVITSWAFEPFIEPAIKQALEYCDEVLVDISSHHPKLNKYEDNSLEIAKSFGDKIYLTTGLGGSSSHSGTKGRIITNMLNATNNNKRDNWIWILDADEFYFDDEIDEYMKIMKSGDADVIMTKEKIFYINMYWHGNWKRDRFKRLPYDNVVFDINGFGFDGQARTIHADHCKGMHHYTFLTNPYMKSDFWSIEYGGIDANQQKKISWINDIYLHTDLNQQQEWALKSKEMFGKLSLFGPHFVEPWNVCKEDGTLYEFNGEHPLFIQQTKLPFIEDFRALFKPIDQ